MIRTQRTPKEELTNMDINGNYSLEQMIGKLTISRLADPDIVQALNRSKMSPRTLIVKN